MNGSRFFPMAPSKPFLARLVGWRDMPPQHSSRTPHLSPFPLCSPYDPFCCTISPKIAHFKGFLELAWAHMGPRWLTMALIATVLSTPSGAATALEKIILDRFWTHR